MFLRLPLLKYFCKKMYKEDGCEDYPFILYLLILRF